MIGSPSFNELAEIYSEDEICLFTGAGVSFTAAKHYRAPGWSDLLADVYERIRSTIAHPDRLPDLEQLELQANGDEWEVATQLLLMLDNDERRFVRIIADALVGRTTTNDKYRRLPIAYLKAAPTLNAIIAFCSRLRAIRRHPCYEVN